MISNQLPAAQVIGAIGIVLGILALVIPLFGALGSCVPFVDGICEDACTPCTDVQKEVSCRLFCGDSGTSGRELGWRNFGNGTGKPEAIGAQSVLKL